MMLGARNGAWAQSGGGGEWTNPYITDGLVGYWDGEWNSEGGKHDAVQDSLVDLSGGGHDMTFVGTHQLNPKSVTIDGVASGAYGSINGLTWGPQSTQEFVVNITSNQMYGRMIAENKGLCVLNSPGGFSVGHCYGYGTDGPIGKLKSVLLGLPLSVVMTYDGTYLRYYVNGQYENSKLQNFNSYLSGQTTFFNRINGGRGIDGQLHSVRLYSRALSADEIADNYSVDKTRFNLK